MKLTPAWRAKRPRHAHPSRSLMTDVQQVQANRPVDLRSTSQAVQRLQKPTSAPVPMKRPANRPQPVMPQVNHQAEEVVNFFEFMPQTLEKHNNWPQNVHSRLQNVLHFDVQKLVTSWISALRLRSLLRMISQKVKSGWVRLQAIAGLRVAWPITAIIMILAVLAMVALYVLVLRPLHP